jgi:hypothetical protein
MLKIERLTLKTALHIIPSGFSAGESVLLCLSETRWVSREKTVRSHKVTNGSQSNYRVLSVLEFF